MENFNETSYRPQPVMAGFGLRLVAIILDSIFIVLIFGAFIFIYAHFIKTSEEVTSPTDNPFFIVGGLLLYFFGLPLLTILYQSLFESSIMQGTPGKMIMEIQVVNERFRRASFGRCLVRNVCRILSSAIFMIGYLIALFSDKKQTLHDLIAGTFVVKRF